MTDEETREYIENTVKAMLNIALQDLVNQLVKNFDNRYLGLENGKKLAEGLGKLSELIQKDPPAFKQKVATKDVLAARNIMKILKVEEFKRKGIKVEEEPTQIENKKEDEPSAA